MKRLTILIVIVIFVIFSAFAVYTNFVDRAKVNRIDIRGTVTNVTIYGDTVTILVEGQMENDTYYDKASVRIDKNTLVTKMLYTNKIDMTQIKEGYKVEVTFIGPVAESYPVQAAAEKVNIIE